MLCRDIRGSMVKMLMESWHIPVLGLFSIFKVIPRSRQLHIVSLRPGIRNFSHSQ